MGSNPPVFHSHGQTTVGGNPIAEPELLPPDASYTPSAFRLRCVSSVVPGSMPP